MVRSSWKLYETHSSKYSQGFLIIFHLVWGDNRKYYVIKDQNFHSYTRRKIAQRTPLQMAPNMNRLHGNGSIGWEGNFVKADGNIHFRSMYKPDYRKTTM